MSRWTQLDLPGVEREPSPWELRCARYAGRPVDAERVLAWSACAPCGTCGAELGEVDGGYLVLALLPADERARIEVLAAAKDQRALVLRAAAPGALVCCWGCVLEAVRAAGGS